MAHASGTAPSLPAAPSGGLRYSSDGEPGLGRRSAAKGFRYVASNGRAVRDRATLERIKALVIPPAWERVWICADGRGHLQATGRDARGRKQYRYHAAQRQWRDGAKFMRMNNSGEALPR